MKRMILVSLLCLSALQTGCVATDTVAAIAVLTDGVKMIQELLGYLPIA